MSMFFFSFWLYIDININMCIFKNFSSSRLIDGSRVIEETIINLGTSDNLGNRNSEEQPRSGPDMPSASHNAPITDLLICKTDKQQTFVVSSARDGVIKIWK